MVDCRELSVFGAPGLFPAEQLLFALMVENAWVLLGEVMLLIELGESLPMRSTCRHLPRLRGFLRGFCLRWPFSFVGARLRYSCLRSFLLQVVGLLLPSRLGVRWQRLLAGWIRELDRCPLLVVLDEAGMVLPSLEEAECLPDTVGEPGKEQEPLV